MGLAVRPSCPLFLPFDQGFLCPAYLCVQDPGNSWGPLNSVLRHCWESGMSVTMLSLEKILLFQGLPITIEESPLGSRGCVEGGIS